VGQNPITPFETGTPTFLVETIRNEYVNPKELERIKVDNYFFNSFSLEHLDILSVCCTKQVI
jgi:hypothetical protein